MKLILIFVCLVGISCNPLKKTQRYLFEHPEFSAEYCAEQYPAKDSIVTRDVIRYDTVLEILNFTDSILLKGDTVYKYNTLYKTIIKTVTKDSIVYRRDAAEERRLQLALMACQNNNNDLLNKYNEQADQLNKWKGTAKQRFWWILLLIGGGIVYAGVKLKKYFLT